MYAFDLGKAKWIFNIEISKVTTNYTTLKLQKWDIVSNIGYL